MMACHCCCRGKADPPEWPGATTFVLDATSGEIRSVINMVENASGNILQWRNYWSDLSAIATGGNRNVFCLARDSSSIASWRETAAMRFGGKVLYRDEPSNEDINPDALLGSHVEDAVFALGSDPTNSSLTSVVKITPNGEEWTTSVPRSLSEIHIGETGPGGDLFLYAGGWIYRVDAASGSVSSVHPGVQSAFIPGGFSWFLYTRPHYQAVVSFDQSTGNVYWVHGLYHIPRVSAADISGTPMFVRDVSSEMTLQEWGFISLSETGLYAATQDSGTYPNVGRLVRLSTTDGSVISESVPYTPPSSVNAIRAVAFNGGAIVDTVDGTTCFLDSDSGAISWQIPGNHPFIAQDPETGYLIAFQYGTSVPWFHQTTETISAIVPETGEVVWKVEFPQFVMTMDVGAGFVIASAKYHTAAEVANVHP